ncbi:hypothetical protein KAH81_10390 [bacterium]|nr:hypothetical protein [bacterium]
MKKTTIILIFVLVLSLAVSAQHAPPEGHGGKAHLRERIGLIKMWKLIEVLELNEEQSMVFFPAMKEHDSRLQHLKEEEDRLLGKLEAQLDAVVIDNVALGATVDSVVYLRDDRLATDLEFFNKLNDVLDVKQRAKLLLFEKNFDKEIRGVIDMGVRNDKRRDYRMPSNNK